jgi:hypothetical protein
VAKRHRPTGFTLPTQEEVADARTPDDVLTDAAAESEHLATELKQVGWYLDELHAKQPRELLKRARAARKPSRIAEAREFMRGLIAAGQFPIERILDKAQQRFDYTRATLRRRCLTGLRKETKRRGPV